CALPISEKFKDHRNVSASFDYIFDVPEKLSNVLALKASLGVKLKQAYDHQDESELQRIVSDVIPEIIARVKKLREAHRTQWLTSNKPLGRDVIDIRYGGILNRDDSA